MLRMCYKLSARQTKAIDLQQTRRMSWVSMGSSLKNGSHPTGQAPIASIPAVHTQLIYTQTHTHTLMWLNGRCCEGSVVWWCHAVLCRFTTLWWLVSQRNMVPEEKRTSWVQMGSFANFSSPRPLFSLLFPSKPHPSPLSTLWPLHPEPSFISCCIHTAEYSVSQGWPFARCWVLTMKLS